MESNKLKEVLDKHLKYLLNEEGGEHANLYGANLRGASLYGANLRDASLCGADLRCADLRDASLCGADLRCADLRDADLRDASLYGANLRGADLRDASLYGANLRCADLRDANLRGADLYGANLRDANGNGSELKNLSISSTYSITYTHDHLQIGCQRHTIDEWWLFDDERIIQMDGKTALKFWRKYKEILQKIIELSPAKESK